MACAPPPAPPLRALSAPPVQVLPRCGQRSRHRAYDDAAAASEAQAEETFEVRSLFEQLLALAVASRLQAVCLRGGREARQACGGRGVAVGWRRGIDVQRVRLVRGTCAGAMCLHDCVHSHLEGPRMATAERK